MHQRCAFCAGHIISTIFIAFPAPFRFRLVFLLAHDPPTIDVAEGLIEAEQHQERDKWKPPPQHKRARQPQVQAVLKARKEKTSATCSSVPALAAAPAPVCVASGMSEPLRAAMPTDSSSRSDCSTDNDNSSDFSSGTCVDAPRKKKQKTKCKPAVCKPREDLVQFLTSFGHQKYAEALVAGGFSSMAELSMATQKALKLCGLLEENALRVRTDLKKRQALGVIPKKQMAIPAGFAAARHKQCSKK